MRRERFYIRRVKPVRRNGQFTLEPLPDKPEEFNCGVTYDFVGERTSDKTAVCYGWETGYPQGMNELSTPQAYLRAPHGFNKGNLVYVTGEDLMIGISTRDLSTLDKFSDSLDKSGIEEIIKQIQGFSFIGVVE